jgi:release factor glutamine methyltransferase
MALALRLKGFLPEPEARAESWRWFEEGLGWGKARILGFGEERISEDAQCQIEAWLERRSLGEPWAYILGWAVWRGRRFFVTPATLIPRPETELVLETALRLAKQNGALDVVDVGTGSGILGIAMALEAKLDVTATDTSQDALDVAKKNAKEHNVELGWAQGCLLEPVAGPIDMVVSNLPYVDPRTKTGLQRELAFEPAIALFANDDGMGQIKKLLLQAHKRRVKCLVMEIGAGQGAELMSTAFNVGWQNIEIKQDMASHDRVLVVSS